MTVFTNDESSQKTAPPAPSSLTGAFLYGAGGRGCALAAYFLQAGIPMGGFVVTNGVDKEKSVMGMPVVSIHDFSKKYSDVPLIISSKFEPEMLATCDDLGIKTVFTFYQALEILGISLNYQTLSTDDIFKDPDVIAGLNVWDDDASREKYRRLIQLHCSPHAKFVPECEPDQYFSPQYISKRFLRAVVDGGAYNGDTLRDLLALIGDDYEAYYAFEPDPETFMQLATSELIQDARIRTFCLGLSDHKDSVAMMCFGGLGSFIAENGNVRIKTVPLDNIIGGHPVSMIKLDVEGHEEAALRGAEKTIHDQHPALAIAIYHNIAHLWKIPLWIKNIGGYKLRLGHHSRDHDESICYAIPE